MKNVTLMILINFFLVSCIDIITEEEFYESVHIEGSGWFEFYENDEFENSIFSESFTVQIWFSGQNNIGDMGPCILNIKNEIGNLAIYRDLHINNNLIIYLNDMLIEEVEITDMNLEEKENFYLLSVVIDDNNGSLYLNDVMIKDDIEINGMEHNIIVGGRLDTNNSPNNLWYGYIDEIRIWNTALTEEIISFHNQYPDKVSSSYEDEYLPHLIGLWDFKIDSYIETIPYIFQDINENNIYAIIYTLEFMTNELSLLGR